MPVAHCNSSNGPGRSLAAAPAAAEVATIELAADRRQTDGAGSNQ